MQIPFVDLKAQYLSIQTEIDQAIAEVIANTAFIGGTAVENFNRNFASFCNTKRAIGCGNGTDAIEILLLALEIGNGDEVIVPANSFIASSEAVTRTGARVVFADVDDNTANINPVDVRNKITKNTKAILAVHLYGNPAPMNELAEIAETNNIFLLEDAAQAHAAIYDDRVAGSIGHAATFSFYPGKNLGAYGDGGAVVTNDEVLAKKVKMIANHGRITKYDHEFEGMNSRLDGLQAAILNVKLNYLKDWTQSRQRIAAKYDQAFVDIPEIRVYQPLPNAESVYHLYVIRIKKREVLQAYLKQQNIATGIHYPIGLPYLQAYKYLGHSSDDFPLTYANQTTQLSLPIYPEMTDAEVEYIIGHIRKYYQAEAS
jgi:dTDP-4-amino-4,6-dideoxygalactose transaminase